MSVRRLTGLGIVPLRRLVFGAAMVYYVQGFAWVEGGPRCGCSAAGCWQVVAGFVTVKLVTRSCEEREERGGGLKRRTQ